MSKTLGSKLYFRRGLALENLGRKREALADMQAAMELDDDRGIEKALLRLTRECPMLRQPRFLFHFLACSRHIAKSHIERFSGFMSLDGCL